MEMRQTTLSMWRRPYQLEPGRDGAGPQASRGPTQATGASVNLKARGRQSRATGQTTQSPPITLKVVHWNAEGVSGKHGPLSDFLKDHEIDAICIQETHLNASLRFSMEGFQIFRKDRAKRPKEGTTTQRTKRRPKKPSTTPHIKGGIMTLIKNSIPAVEVSNSQKEDLESHTIKLLLPSGALHITNCYSPPDTTLALHNIKVEESRHLVIGDFNSHSPSWGYAKPDSRGEEVEDWMIENKLILINKPHEKPTCYSRGWKTSSTPDLAMATGEIHKLTIREVCSQLGGSDHRPVILNIHSIGYTEHIMAPSWNYKKAKWNAFREKGERSCASLTTDNSLNKDVKLYTQAVMKAAKHTIPRGKRRYYKPFWSEALKNLHGKLSSARDAMEQNPTHENTVQHNEIKDTYNKQKKAEIQKSWNEKTSSLDMEKDLNKLWRLTKVLNEDAGEKYSKTVLEEDGEHHTGKQAANIIADFYKEESKTTISNERIKEVRREIKERLKSQNPPPSMMSPYSLKDLNSSIKKLKTKKAPGKDGVANEMIKNLGPIARQKLLDIINKSWNTGKLPDSWREAITIPIRKKGKDKTKKSSYRPISLLSCLCKVMERMVNTRLMAHLEENNLLNNSQSAYRKNRSTEDQLVYLIQKIENAFQEKKKVLAVFVDLTKAFDKVWKEGLLLKLLRKKIEGKMYTWIQNYLQYRTTRVKLDGKTSHRVTLQQGVPQGGVISPTLFLIFIDDIVDQLSQHIGRALHADDFAAWCESEHLSTARYRMQEVLDQIGTWTSDWGVELNQSKTVTTIFSLSTLPESVSLKIHGKKLKQESNPTYLGVKLDKRLTWSPHLRDVETKATRKIAIMKRLAGTTWGANSTILQRVYTGSIRPTLEYGSSAWAAASNPNKSHLDKVQNTGLRLITGGIKSTPIKAMEKYTGLHSLEDRREEKMLIHSEKLLRLPTHPMNREIQNLTKNRLKRSSFNHQQKNLHSRNRDLLPTISEEIEILSPSTVSHDPDDHLENISISTEVPGIAGKNLQTPIQQKSLTLEMIDASYHHTEWTQVFTDGSADGAVKNGGAGVFIKHMDGKHSTRSFPTGKISTNFRAESTALLHAIKIFSQAPDPPSKIVFFTDCRSLLQTLQKDCTDQQTQDIREALSGLSKQSTVSLQWVPSHCGIAGNEKADALSKEGSKMEQFSHPVSYKEAKTIIHNRYQSKWKEKRGADKSLDAIHLLQRQQQTILFRLRTGHCRLLSHLYKLKISHTNECPCGTGLQTPTHILQFCPKYNVLRCQTWPMGAELNKKLWGDRNDLEKTAGFAIKTGLEI